MHYQMIKNKQSLPHVKLVCYVNKSVNLNVITESMRIWTMRNDEIDKKYQALLDKQPQPTPQDK
eukprot:UN08105